MTVSYQLVGVWFKEWTGDQARVFGIVPKEEKAAQQQPGVVLQQYTLSTKPNNLLVGKRKHEGDDEEDPTED